MSHVDDGRLNALLDGELSPAEEREVEQHLAGCAACRARLEEARSFLAAADSLLGAIAPPAALPAAPPAAAPVQAGSPPGGRRSSVTAKEAAIDIDGATHQSPAIRLFPQQQERHGLHPPEKDRPAGGRAARPWPWTRLAWAASIVLTFSVGYLASDLRHGGTPTGSLADERAAGPGVADSALAAVASRAEARQPPRRAATSQRTPATDPASSAGNRAGTRGGPTPLSPAVTQPKAAPAEADLGDMAAARDQPPRDQRALAAAPPPAPTGGMPAAPGAAAPTQPAAGAGAERARLEEAPVVTRRAPAQRAATPSFRRTNLDTAVVHLSGSIRLIDGMDHQRVEMGPGSLVPGAQPGIEVVRVIYMDSRGRRIALDQQRLPAAAEADAVGGAAMLYGDTLTSTSGATTWVRWLDNKNFWMSLSAALPAESLRVLAERVR